MYYLLYELGIFRWFGSWNIFCICACVAQVVRYVHSLLLKLTSMFPTEPTGSSVSCKYEELDSLYVSIGKVSPTCTVT